MAYETILTDTADGILTLTLNRPDKLNAFTTAMMTELIDAFDRADADDAVRAVIVTGAGRAFCAGADLSRGGATFDRNARPDRPPVPTGPDGAPDLSHEAARDGGGRLTLRIFNCRKPVIAAVNGAAVGIGVTMLLPMDVRIASEDARFGFVFSQRGIVPEACSSFFPAAPGRHPAGARLVLRGRGVPGLRGARRRPREQGRGRARALAGRAGVGARVHREICAGLGRTDPSDDVADARRRSSDGGAPARQPRHVPPRPQRRRQGRHRRFPGETPCPFRRQSLGRHAAALALAR
jgi:enoyl-CoA hydratase/carnithine racemase